MRLPLNQGWRFRRLDRPGLPSQPVDLPHSPFVADLDGREHWFGECEYEREIAAALPAGGRCVLHVGAAMHTCVALVHGREIARHTGGYLPFELDLTGELDAAGRCTVTLRLDNRDQPDIPPGKPYDELDFCWYGGLYRDAELRLLPAVHLTSALSAGEVAGGGVFLRTLAASAAGAEVLSRAHVRNTSPQPRRLRVRTEFHRDGRVAATATSDAFVLAAGAAQHVEALVSLAQPALWSPAAPQLHDVTVTVLDETGEVLDAQALRYGIRRIAFSRSGGFTINGRRLRLRGANRHQEFPRVGYAAPRAAQVRDARRIKEAGFDYVRLSHYPPSPAFLDACDELGLVAMNCIPGWQHLGGEAFRAAAFADARQLIRRDRNHACVVLWELSLNETAMDDAFMARLHAIGHEEYPGDQLYTCGWIDRYDVFGHARQHGEMHRWSNGDKALVITEYGDWEFYARNEGFDQKLGTGLHDPKNTSRQFRGDGETGMLRQVENYLTALNDTLASPAALDGLWAVFDYARGYHPLRAAVGVMDIFRLPKFSYHFYRSQRDATETGAGWTGGPVVFIASHWTAASSPQVLVFSNCAEVELILNGRSLDRRGPSRTAAEANLPHPPFRFELVRFEPGTLEAVGWTGGQAVARHSVRTPGATARLSLAVDSLGVRAAPDEPDVLFVHARLLDAAGTLNIADTSAVTFAVEGAELVGPATLAAEAGIASLVVRVQPGAGTFTVSARPAGPAGLPPARLRWPTEA